jgi:hypothetical protein
MFRRDEVSSIVNEESRFCDMFPRTEGTTESAAAELAGFATPTISGESQ